MTWKDYFKGKRVALIGLGAHGELVADAKFMIDAGAILSVYDLRSEARLKSHLVFLRSEGLANYVCGSIPAEDLIDMDVIVMSHEYDRSSSFLKDVVTKGVSVEYPETLFFKLSPPVTLVAIIGVFGKTTTMSIMSPMLDWACKNISKSKKKDSLDDMMADTMIKSVGRGQKFFSYDYESGNGILSLLKRIKNGDILLLKVTDLVYSELRDMHISPHVSIFTSLPDKKTYSEHPFEILEYQTYNNFIVANDDIIDATRLYKFQPKAKMLRTKKTILPEDWLFKGNKQDRDNAALAIQVAKLFKVSDDMISEIVGSWKPLKGRLEMIKKIKNVEFYNDATSITPDSTIASLMQISSDGKNIVLIMGGADCGCDYKELNNILPRYVRTVILLPGSGTIKERKELGQVEELEILSAPTVEEAVLISKEISKPGDKVLFSPAFAAGGFDLSRKERSERFARAVKNVQ